MSQSTTVTLQTQLDEQGNEQSQAIQQRLGEAEEEEYPEDGEDFPERKSDNIVNPDAPPSSPKYKIGQWVNVAIQTESGWERADHKVKERKFFWTPEATWKYQLTDAKGVLQYGGAWIRELSMKRGTKPT